MSRRGPELIEETQRLVISALEGAPEGLTNAELDEAVQLNLPIPSHRGYITWTILQYLIQCGKVERIGEISYYARPWHKKARHIVAPANGTQLGRPHRTASPRSA